MRAPECDIQLSPTLGLGIKNQPFCKPSQSTAISPATSMAYRPARSRTRPPLVGVDLVDGAEPDSASTLLNRSEATEASSRAAEPSVQELVGGLREDIMERLASVEGKLGQVHCLQKQLLRSQCTAGCSGLFKPPTSGRKDSEVPRPRPSSAKSDLCPPATMAPLRHSPPPPPAVGADSSWNYRRATIQHLTGDSSDSMTSTAKPLKAAHRAWTVGALDDKGLLSSDRASEVSRPELAKVGPLESHSEETAVPIEPSSSWAPRQTSPSARSSMRKTSMNSVSSIRRSATAVSVMSHVRRSSTGASLVLSRLRRAGASTWHKKVWAFLEDPSSSRMARCFWAIWDPFIVATVFVAMLQTINPSPIPWLVAASLEISFDALFTLEVLLRYSVCQNTCSFLKDLYNIIDICAAVPPLVIRVVLLVGSRWALAWEVVDDTLARDLLVCVVPLLRVLKTLRRFDMFHLFVMLMRTILEALRVLLFALFILVLSFSSLIYIVEPRENIESVPQAMWLTIVTVTTVGYGDITPTSTPGTCVVAVLVLCSVLYMAMPIGIIGNAFTQIWQDRDRILLMLRTRERLAHWGYEVSDLIHLFKFFDADRDGMLCIEEFRKMIGEMQLGLNEERVAELFDSIDKDGSGGIEAKELVHCLFPHAYHQVYNMKRKDSLASMDGQEGSGVGDAGPPTSLDAAADHARRLSAEDQRGLHPPGLVTEEALSLNDEAEARVPKTSIDLSEEASTFRSVVPTPPVRRFAA